MNLRNRDGAIIGHVVVTRNMAGEIMRVRTTRNEKPECTCGRPHIWHPALKEARR